MDLYLYYCEHRESVPRYRVSSQITYTQGYTVGCVASCASDSTHCQVAQPGWVIF